MHKLLIATTNPAKLGEFKKFLADVPIELLSLAEAGITEKAPETGKTFTENAIMKAKFYAQLSGFATLADDGGFEIDALDGEPGVRSHRWVHKDREDTDEEILEHTIERLKNIPLVKRGAQLRLVLAFFPLSSQVVTVEEVERGVVPEIPSEQRESGFPYRSLLYFPEIKKCYSELTASEFEQYNHRKRAVEKLKPTITEFLVSFDKAQDRRSS